jgi:hypothetical protein
MGVRGARSLGDAVAALSLAGDVTGATVSDPGGWSTPLGGASGSARRRPHASGELTVDPGCSSGGVVDTFVGVFGTNPLVHGLVGGRLALLPASRSSPAPLASLSPGRVDGGCRPRYRGDRAILARAGAGRRVARAALFNRADAADTAGSEPVDDTRLASVVLFIPATTLHSVPEMLAVSITAVSAGLDRRLYAAATGVQASVTESHLAVLGAVAATLVSPVHPCVIGFVTGAMLSVVSDETVPETHRRGNERVATLGMAAGAVVTLYLGVALRA